MYNQPLHTDAYRPPNTDPPTVRAQVAAAVVLLAVAWALTHPTVGLPALAALAALAWHRRVARLRAGTRPTEPPD